MDNTIHLRVGNATKKKLEQQAKEAGLTLSAYARVVLTKSTLKVTSKNSKAVM